MKCLCVVMSPSQAEWIINNNARESHHDSTASSELQGTIRSSPSPTSAVMDRWSRRHTYFTLAHPSNPRRPGDTWPLRYRYRSLKCGCCHVARSSSGGSCYECGICCVTTKVRTFLCIVSMAIMRAFIANSRAPCSSIRSIHTCYISLSCETFCKV